MPLQKLSHGDFYTLAGVVAVEAMGGPLVKWRAGENCRFCSSLWMGGGGGGIVFSLFLSVDGS